MPAHNDAVLRLLIVDDSVEAAEAIVSGLRNGGIAVRPSRPEGEDELQALVGGQPIDLVLHDDQCSGCVDVKSLDVESLDVETSGG